VSKKVLVGLGVVVFMGLCVALIPPLDEEPAQEESRAESGGAMASVQCIEVSRAMLNVIESGLDIAGDGGLSRGMAVKSDDYPMEAWVGDLWFIAADFRGPGMDGQHGVWGTNKANADDTGMIFAASPYAVEFSQWGDGRQTDAEIGPGKHGYEEAQECLARSR
jgi:hypothetical protein